MGAAENQDPLEACMETVQRLEEENVQLRQSAGAFGQLAERLNQTLREDGTSDPNGDRRPVPPPGGAAPCTSSRRDIDSSRPSQGGGGLARNDTTASASAQDHE
ncbi:MAG: hypothetical protein ABJC51_06730 [Acidobacteriota bacterium]